MQTKNIHFRRRLTGTVSRTQFSLIELLVVLTIIGLVAGLVGPNLIGKIGQGKQKTARMQIHVFKDGVTSFYLDMNQYPGSLEDLVRNPGSSPKWNGPYLDQALVPPDPWDNDYHLDIPGQAGRSFDLYSYGRDNTPGGDGEDADVVSWIEK